MADSRDQSRCDARRPSVSPGGPLSLSRCEEMALANLTDNCAELDLEPQESVLATVHSVLLKRFGGALERHRDRLLAVVQETAELLELPKISWERPLTPDEEKRVPEHGVDLLKAILTLAPSHQISESPAAAE